MARLRDLAVDIVPLRSSRQFRHLYVGLTSSAIGSRITDVAVPIQVYAITRSTLAVGLLGLVTLAPHLGLSLVGGALADRFDRRRLLVVTELGGLACSLVLAANALLPAPRLWVVYVAVAGAGAFGAVAMPAQRSAVPLVVAREHLVGAMALTSMAYSASWLLGPLLAGLLSAAGGSALAYLTDALTFVLGVVALARMAPVRPVGEAAGSMVRSVTDGLRELRHRPPLVGSFLMDLNAMVFGFPAALFPAVVEQRFGGDPTLVGVLYAAPFAGSLLASTTSGWARRVHRHGVAITWSVVAWGLCIAGFGLARGLALGVGFLVLAGAADMVSGVFRQTLLASATPPELLGRMEGVGMAVWATGPALGDVEAGLVASLTSVAFSIVSGGVVCAGLAWVIAGALPAFRRYDVRADATMVG